MEPTTGENLHSVSSPKSVIPPKITINAMSAFSESVNICDKINAKVAASVVKQKSVFTSNQPKVKKAVSFTQIGFHSHFLSCSGSYIYIYSCTM